MISFKILMMFFLCSILVNVLKAEEYIPVKGKDFIEWTCKKCGKVNSYLQTSGYFPDAKYSEKESEYKEYNEKQIEELKKRVKEEKERYDKISGEFARKNQNEKKKFMKENYLLMYMDLPAVEVHFDDNSYICDDRIVGEGGEKHKAKFKKFGARYYVFVYKDVAYVCCCPGDPRCFYRGDPRCRYCWDGGKEEDFFDSKYCIDLSKFNTEGTDDGFCEFDKKALVQTKRKLGCCPKLFCCCCKFLYFSYDNKNTGLLENLDKENKWCRLEDCHGVRLERQGPGSISVPRL